MTNSPTLMRLPAVDGLRGLAVLAVVLFHAGSFSGGPLYLSGGFLGVSLFFVISGYVITRLVLDEHARTSTVDLRRFAGRRVARLAPAALITILAVVLVSRTPLASWSTPEGFRSTDALSATWNVGNWSLATLPDSVGFRLAHPLAHFWSLSVEAQLYLLFAFAVLACRSGDLRRRLMVLSAGAWLGSLCMALVVHGSVRREEFGTDIRLAEFAAGVLLATVLPQALPFLRRHRGVVDAVGTALVGLFVLVVMFVHRDDFWLGNGGYALLGLAWAALVGIAARGGRITAALSRPKLVHLGTISYSLYLVHWPLVLMLTDARLQSHGALAVILRIALSLLLAEIVHYFVELPLRTRLSSHSTRRLLGIWMGAMLLVSAAAVALV